MRTNQCECECEGEWVVKGRYYKSSSRVVSCRRRRTMEIAARQWGRRGLKIKIEASQRRPVCLRWRDLRAAVAAVAAAATDCTYVDWRRLLYNKKRLKVGECFTAPVSRVDLIRYFNYSVVAARPHAAVSERRPSATWLFRHASITPPSPLSLSEGGGEGKKTKQKKKRNTRLNLDWAIINKTMIWWYYRYFNIKTRTHARTLLSCQLVVTFFFFFFFLSHKNRMRPFHSSPSFLPNVVDIQTHGGRGGGECCSKGPIKTKFSSP